MFRIGRFLLLMLGITTGAFLYIGFNWVPIIGPVLIGVFIAKLAKPSVRDGFFAGVLAGLFGFILLTGAILAYGLGWFMTSTIKIVALILLAWIFLLWNLAGILLTGLGCALGSAVFRVGRIVEKTQELFGKKDREVTDLRNVVLCKNCGVENLKGNRYCSICGEKI